MRSLAYGSRLKNRELGSGVCIYIYPGGTPSVSEVWVLSPSSGGTGGFPGLGGAGRGGGAPVPLRLQPVCESFAVPFWQGRQPSIWFSRTIAWCLSIAAFTLLCLGNTTPRLLSSRISARSFLIMCCVSSMAVRKQHFLAILAIFKARGMSDCSSCTRPPCLAIVADMLKTYLKFVAASRVRIGCYLNHRQLGGLLWGLWSLFGRFLGTFETQFVGENPGTKNIVMFHFADSADKCVGSPWGLTVMGSDELAT